MAMNMTQAAAAAESIPAMNNRYVCIKDQIQNINLVIGWMVAALTAAPGIMYGGIT